MTSKLVAVHPRPGVTVHVGGGHVAFEPGRPVHVPEDHAQELVEAGHVALQPWPEEIAGPGALAPREAALGR